MDRPILTGGNQQSHGTAHALASADFETLLGDLRRHIEQRLNDLYPDDQNDSGSALRAAISHGVLSPGKRLRPLITLLSCRQCGGDTLDALDAACAVEIVHAASLIVDDLPCMDNASMRRSGPSTHAAYGEGVSILAAITLVNDAFRTLSLMERIDYQKRIAACEKLSNAIGVNGLAGGQERDLSRTGSATGDMLAVEQTHLEKTGALFAAAAGIGAIIAGARAVEVEAMERYGAALGLAYQTFDDVIDAACDQSQTGKDAGQDENRTTIVTLMGARKAYKSGNHWVAKAREHAYKVDCGAGAPLINLADAVEAKFKALTSKT